jgi:AcrR family transcriptional regulator
MSPRPDVSEARQGQILEAAVKVFVRLGLDQARMDDIGAEAGLSKGALYWYFKSKDEIITAILDKLFDRELVELQERLEADGPVRERLLGFVRHAAAELKAMQHLRPILYEFYGLAFRDRKVRAALRADLRRTVQVAAPLIQQGVARGELRPLAPGEGARGLAAIIEGSMLLWVFDPGAFDLEAQIESAAGIYLDGLAAA